MFDSTIKFNHNIHWERYCYKCLVEIFCKGNNSRCIYPSVCAFGLCKNSGNEGYIDYGEKYIEKSTQINLNNLINEGKVHNKEESLLESKQNTV